MTFHSIERLGPPFHSVSEYCVVIPKEGELIIPNKEWKILFFLQANCLLEIDQSTTLQIKSGDILIVPQRCLQHYRLTKENGNPRLHLFKILLVFPALPDAGPSVSKQRPLNGDPEADLTAFVRHHFSEIRHLPAQQATTNQEIAVKEIMLAVRREAEQQRTGIRHRVRGLSTNLLVHVARRLHETPIGIAPVGGGHDAVVNHTKEYLLHNFARSLTLGEIAWNVKLSEEHLARVFRKVTGQTVFDYLCVVRLENVKTLLINSSLTLTEIATRTGFGSLSLLSRNFKQHIGLPPSIYREQRAHCVSWSSDTALPDTASSGKAPQK